jgi:hypothetical protein
MGKTNIAKNKKAPNAPRPNNNKSFLIAVYS